MTVIDTSRDDVTGSNTSGANALLPSHDLSFGERVFFLPFTKVYYVVVVVLYRLIIILSTRTLLGKKSRKIRSAIRARSRYNVVMY